MRQITLTEKKLRGIPRRLRALRKWSERFDEVFCGWENMTGEFRYWNYKIPVHSSLVEGKQTNQALQTECAQYLINACGKLIASKPDSAVLCRVTCVICLPDMFSSEICVYFDESYFQGHTSAGSDKYGSAECLHGRSLSKEWGLALPNDVQELGISVDFESKEADWRLKGERWYFGEVK